MSMSVACQWTIIHPARQLAASQSIDFRNKKWQEYDLCKMDSCLFTLFTQNARPGKKACEGTRGHWNQDSERPAGPPNR